MNRLTELLDRWLSPPRSAYERCIAEDCPKPAPHAMGSPGCTATLWDL